MKHILKYSVLRYSPSKIAGEKINLGIIFVDEEHDFRHFRYTKKLSRLTNFDDEIDLKMVKALLKGIEEDVKGTLFTKNFDIDAYTKYYINDFCFETPKMIPYTDLDGMIEKLNKTYFRFDYEKKERPSKEDDRKLIESLITAKGKSIKRNEYVLGSFDERIRYDIVTDDFKIKIFDFDNKNLNKLINSAKSWAWNCMFDSEKKSVIIYRYSEDSDERSRAEFETIMKIFKSAEANIYDIDDGIQFLQHIQ